MDKISKKETTMLMELEHFDAEVVNNELCVTDDRTKNVEKYKLTKLPPVDSGLVSIQKRTMLGLIDLEKMLFQLELCVDLYQIVYNAVNGITGLHSKVTQLRLDFCSAMGTSEDTALEFEATTRNVANSLKSVYSFLMAGDQTTALTIMASIGDKAADMQEKSTALMQTFKTVKKGTEEVLISVVSTNEALYAKEEAFKKERAEQEAELAAYQVLVEEYQKKATRIQQEIDEMKELATTQEERQFTTEMMGIFTNMFSGAIQAFAGSSSMSSHGTPKSTELADLSSKNMVSNDGEKQKYTTENDTYLAAKAEVEKIEKRIEEIKKVLNDESFSKEKTNIAPDKKTDADKTENELQEEKQTSEGKKKEKEAERDKAKAQAEIYRKTLEALGVVFDTVSGKIQEMGEDSKKKVDSLRGQISELRAEKNKIEDIYTMNLSKMAAVMKKIETNLNGQKDVDVAIDSLLLAISALGRIISVLEQMTTFWDRIQSSCKVLKAEQKDIEVMASSSVIAILCREGEFAFQYFSFMAHWVALNSIFSDYLDAVSEVHVRMEDSLGEEEMRREEHWAQAKELAADMNNRLNAEIINAKKDRD